jgi:sialate O-acetylesterase
MPKNPLGPRGIASLLAGILILVDPLAAASSPAADPLPFVSPIFGDNMVLQRGKPNAIWGWSKPGDAVRVEIQGGSSTAVASADGKWRVVLAVPPAGGPYSVIIHGGQQERTLHNVLVGDVWLCGGQSNMFLGILATRNGAEEAKSADHPDLRLYMVDHRAAYGAAAVPAGEWKVCSPATLVQAGAGGFSAVAYYFARRLQGELHIPIGLVEDCVGGSPAESWISGESLTAMGELGPQVAAMEKLRAAGAPEYGSFLMHWLDDYDVGLRGEPWYSADLADADWPIVDVPGVPASPASAGAPGVCWFRREITLPSPLPKGDARIFLGSIDKMDTAYVNGQWVGASSWVENPRVYGVPASVLRPGRNVVALRIFTVKPIQGFLAKPDGLRMLLADGTSVPLSGKWKARVSVDARQPHPLPLDLENYATMPAVFYEGMIAPIAPLALTGVIWYQGEANTAHGLQYRKLLPGLISCWRSLFGQGDFPFYIVSLPAFMARRAEPGDDGWAEVRDAQARTARTVPNSGLAVTIDTGEADNIHPKDKKVVGERLALCALAQYYKAAVDDSGPVFTAMERMPGSVRLHFSHVDGGLVIHGEKLGEFSVAGNDHRWHWADARIDGDTVVLSSQGVPDPVAVRYAWQANPAATLFNSSGLPAGPFRTDDWDFDSQ